MFINLLYVFFAVLVAVGSLVILFAKQEFFALLMLILIVIFLSTLYFLQGAPFVSIIQLILHAGGILVLLICSLLFFKHAIKAPNNTDNKIIYKRIVIGAISIGLVGYLCNKLSTISYLFNLPASNRPVGTIQQLGYQILGPYGLILELISILLLITLVGVLHIIHQRYKTPNK
ncbi:hypothetical protein Aasi_1025 [Candidatus Amoebophilus asiaticus 5a2]|uniref:NADH-quinone oxidoreductase subunit J n=1 Tax=Amoebophilus asiaticus (strain 5a2) TaxID=452471 RepID=B3ET21_AMOA5|nr:NADH-quinone oxidoreductase subunit J [Candidatus Amoebophilus asiaticus]ACE06373.1 hypothetical protein Aasi_1025 [Candidatus Amoebophilus asiaticus 5a2]